MSQSATSPAAARSADAPRRGLLRALVSRFVLMLLCYNVGIAGYLWYLAMRWVFQHMHLLNGDHGGGRETP